MRLLIRAFLLVVVPGITAAMAQNSTGVITGTIIDAESGQALIGVNVVAPDLSSETVVGTVTDLDGAYRLSIPPGEHRIRFSYVGYETQLVEGVVISVNETTELNIILSFASSELGELVVQADAIQDNTEASLLRMQARSPAILDGISAQQIRRSPDAAAADALRRVTGITLADGRFIFVRGMPERYSTTLFNGSFVPSTEPDRRAFAYDLIPTSLIDNLVITKSATPNLPGDFAGGVLEVQTIDFPSETVASISIGSGITNATGAGYLGGIQGRHDFLGMDSGRRALPDLFPTDNISTGNIYSDDERAGFGQMLNNNWQIEERTGAILPNISASLGSSTDTRIGRFGAIAGFSYRSGISLTDQIRREYEGPDQLRFDFSGQRALSTVTWGGILSGAWRPTPHHSFALKNFYSRVAEDQTSLLTGSQFTDTGANQRLYALRYVSRDVYAGQLTGEHYLGPGTQVQWNVGLATSTRNEPDYRRAVYQRVIGADEEDPFFLLIGPTVSLKNGGRFWSDMYERTWSGGLQSSFPLLASTVTVGTSALTTHRDFDSRMLAAVRSRTQFDNSLLQLPIDSVFLPQYFGLLDKPGCENGGSGCRGFVLAESQTGGTDYVAGQDVLAGFAMVDLKPLERFRIVGGMRIEHSEQRLESTSFSGDTVLVSRPITSLLPSVNFTYNLTDDTNLRLAYGRTVNRPELRELAPFQYYDFELQTTIYGNDSLRQTTVDNLDLRFETYPGVGQMLSASLFYKYIAAPIERAIVPGVALNAERSFTNADGATVWGFEAEARRHLGFIHSYLAESSIIANYTRVWSEVDVPGSATTLARTGRPLQGQSPYVINAGIQFIEPTWGTTISVLYNRMGERIVEVATVNQEDVLETPRDLIDIAISQPIGSRYQLRITVRDLFNQPQQFTQDGLVVRENRMGRSLGFSLSARL